MIIIGIVYFEKVRVGEIRVGRTKRETAMSWAARQSNCNDSKSD